VLDRLPQSSDHHADLAPGDCARGKALFMTAVLYRRRPESRRRRAQGLPLSMRSPLIIRLGEDLAARLVHGIGQGAKCGNVLFWIGRRLEDAGAPVQGRRQHDQAATASDTRYVVMDEVVRWLAANRHRYGVGRHIEAVCKLDRAESDRAEDARVFRMHDQPAAAIAATRNSISATASGSVIMRS
jgi:hypothetical protein